MTNKIITVNLDELDDYERIDLNLKTLAVNIITTIPGSRGFGLNAIVDMNPNMAISQLASELQAGCERYIPEISIREVTGEFIPKTGEYDLTIYVERNPYYDQGDS